MTVDSWQSRAPASAADFAAVLADASDRGASVRFSGGRTKLAWGSAVAEPVLELSTLGLDRIVEHNAGDLTAVLEAGVPLARAQETFAEAGQMLALDPPDPGGATVGGVVASADTGPLRTRWGAPRDVVVGITVALSDGTIARAGGKVIKNVAGYDLSKLFAGSFGTLGAILEVAVRLHPLPEGTVTAAGGSTDPDALARAAAALARTPLEAMSLDVRWGAGDGAVLARFGGIEALSQAEAAARVLGDAGVEATIAEEDDAIWQRQREGQRDAEGTVMRVSALPSGLAQVLHAAERHGARVVGRAPLGVSYLRLPESAPADTAAAVGELRRGLEPAACVVLDAPPGVRALLDPWGPIDAGALGLMRRVKERFDPAGVCAPGLFVGGI